MVSRICIALVLGALGFITGALATWMLTDLPGVSIPSAAALWAACATGAICLVTGFAYGDKITSAATMTGWGAKCSYCGQRAMISVAAARWQFYIFIGAIATIPWMLEGQLQYIAGYAAAAAIVSVGLIAPLRKDLLGPP